MKPKDPLIINNEEIKAGEEKITYIQMPKLYDSTPLSMPVHIIRGKQSGPILGLTAAIHGDELNGIEIIRRILKKKLLNQLSGTLITVPIVNMYGFLYQNRYLMDRRDLNRAFPGSPKGSLASRLAYIMSSEIIDKCTHCIDLHAGSLQRTNLPQIRANLDKKETNKLANVFKAPIILHAQMRDGSMRQYANERSIPSLLYESGESLRFDEQSIKTGVNGILNVMHALKMLKTKPQTTTKKYKSAISRNSCWVRAHQSGLLLNPKALGKSVKKGDLLAKIGTPTSTKEYKLISPVSGIIIGKSNQAVVHEGAALYHIACFEKLKLAREQVEYIQGEMFIDMPDQPDEK